MTRTLKTVNLRGLLEAMTHGTLAHLTRRELKRHMLVLSVKGIEDVLVRERNALGSDFE